MLDLYETLGVARDAEPADIVRAYRRAAKKAHPDSGGSREAFALVTLARDTLTDDERRKRYDETGEAGEKKPDQREAQALNMAIGAINMAIAEVESYIRASDQIVTVAVRSVTSALRERQSEMKRLENAAEKMERLSKRLKAKKGKANRLSPMLLNQAAEQRKAVRTVRDQAEIMTMAIAILEAHEFKPEPAYSNVAAS